ncbi:AbrB/MazE/SpoVT family DNA-binding domain-containing protein [Massilia sp. R2A-15]|uniref:AbrB/MazE/SpoVT family DNA-binding domain-containing protein n=1 Tax=Massilia sp. R2A-15 TaxID=3064278 RepID=UPI002735E667|nr:AbrB/MazE/SpoVT family DNA-binding domain-containing protein [Massilia sp. R2A-15]WLI90213.1 AbrB/MazE/SpoVT family DNA-binding domain-containing protein [Massilia sp. R2A-15]
MELSIQKWGNSAAVRLPSALLTQIGVSLGDKLVVDVKPDGMMLRPARKSYALSDLMAQCDLTAEPPADLAEWDAIERVGHEAW